MAEIRTVARSILGSDTDTLIRMSSESSIATPLVADPARPRSSAVATTTQLSLGTYREYVSHDRVGRWRTIPVAYVLSPRAVEIYVPRTATAQSICWLFFAAAMRVALPRTKEHVA